MLEFAYGVWMSSAFGGLYALLALVFWKSVTTVRPLCTPRFSALALSVPGLIYVALTWGVQDRQGVNWGYANLGLSLFALICLILATRTVRGFWIGVALACLGSVLLWLWIPVRALSRSFF